jgi:hypothetical protein
MYLIVIDLRLFSSYGRCSSVVQRKLCSTEKTYSKEIYLIMKNTLVRGLVLALAVVGFTASSVAASHSGSKNIAKVGSVPKMTGSFPACLPSNPTPCGLD